MLCSKIITKYLVLQSFHVENLNGNCRWTICVIYGTPLGNLIDRDEFYSMFSSEYVELALPYKNYHMETTFEKAIKVWAMELMVLVPDRILKWFDELWHPLDATIVMQLS